MATIKDVAREAGVSIATVSRVFNDSELVSEDTRLHVRNVAARLDYWPNGVARSLITSRTHTLGILLPELHGEFFSGVIRGIDLAARKEGFHLLVSSSHSDTGELVDVLRSVRGRIDGIIVMAPDVEAPGLIQACTGSVPVVLLNPGGRIEECDTISIANFDGAEAVVRHLLELGHRRIATITGPERNVDASERLGGYRSALREGGVDPARELELKGDFTESSGYEAAQALLRLDPRPSAVFVGNDHMAVGVMSALNDSGIRVPDDIAVARYLNPPLTTVHVDTFQLGERAVHRLLSSAASPQAEKHHELLPTRLVIRRSCGAMTRSSAWSRAER